MSNPVREYPKLRAAPPPPDFTGAPCLGRPAEWDIDALDHNRRGIERARRTCVYDCPVILACNRWTRKLAQSTSTRPNGVIQGGIVFGNVMGRPRKGAT